MAWTEEDYEKDAAFASKHNMPPGKSFTRALYNLERIATALEACATMMIEDRQAKEAERVAPDWQDKPNIETTMQDIMRHGD